MAMASEQIEAGKLTAAQGLSIAVIGPDERLRASLIGSLAACHGGEVREFSTYPPKLGDLPHLFDQKHDVILIELDSDAEYALDVMERIGAGSRATVMVYSRKPDPEASDPELLRRCLRVGAREFLTMPFEEKAVSEALERAAGRRPQPRASARTVGRLSVFCGAKGGAGVTTIACNFAMALAQISEKSTLLIDLDLPLGDTAINLGLSPQYSTVDALQNAGRLDENFLSRLLLKHSSGLSVLAAPGTYSIYLPSSDAIGKLLNVARSGFDYVVVDAGSKLDALGTAEHLKEASTVYLVTQAGIPELRNANRLMAQYQTAGGPKVEVVLNRWESQGSRISEDDMKKALTRAATWRIPNDYSAMRRMQDTAAPVMADSNISCQIEQMARAACGLPEVPPKKKGFSLRGLGRPPGARRSGAERACRTVRLELLEDGIRARVPVANAADSAEPGEAADLRRGVSPLKVCLFQNSIYQYSSDGRWELCAEGERPGEIPVVAWAPGNVANGSPLGARQLNATASVPGRFAYTPGEGLVLPPGQHTVWARFTPEDGRLPEVQACAVVRVLEDRPAETRGECCNDDPGGENRSERGSDFFKAIKSSRRWWRR